MLTLVLDLMLLGLVTAAAVNLAFAVPPQPIATAPDQSPVASAIRRGDAIRSIGYNL